MNWNYFKSCSDHCFTFRKVSNTLLWPMLAHPGSTPTRSSHNKELETEDLLDQLPVKFGWKLWTSSWKNKYVILTPTSLHVVIKIYQKFINSLFWQNISINVKIWRRLITKARSNLYKVRLYLTPFVFIDTYADNYVIYSQAYDRAYRVE